MMPHVSFADRRVTITLRLVGLAVMSVILTATLTEAKALLIATDPNAGGGPLQLRSACESVPCEWEIWIDCDGRISLLAGAADDGSNVWIDFRKEQ
jgi:hypothetical protein